MDSKVDVEPQSLSARLRSLLSGGLDQFDEVALGRLHVRESRAFSDRGRRSRD